MSAPPSTHHSRLLDAARSTLRRTGERVTQPRVVVLAALLESEHALSHQGVMDALAGGDVLTTARVDRVTVYRVLEWLVEVGIAHRIAGDDRVWRFMLNQHQTTPQAIASPATPHTHAHFICNGCGQTFCLDTVLPQLPAPLPKGFRSIEIDLKVRGLCSRCS